MTIAVVTVTVPGGTLLMQEFEGAGPNEPTPDEFFYPTIQPDTLANLQGKDAEPPLEPTPPSPPSTPDPASGYTPLA